MKLTNIATVRKSLKRLPTFKNTETHGITLPSSKSLSNRLLIVRGLSGIPVRIENLSDCDDTRRLQQALATPDGTRFDLGDAGTAMRFLTAFLPAAPASANSTVPPVCTSAPSVSSSMPSGASAPASSISALRAVRLSVSMARSLPAAKSPFPLP